MSKRVLFPGVEGLDENILNVLEGIKTPAIVVFSVIFPSEDSVLRLSHSEYGVYALFDNQVGRQMISHRIRDAGTVVLVENFVREILKKLTGFHVEIHHFGRSLGVAR